MDPITLTIIALAISTVVVIALLNWSKIVDWFRNRQGQITAKEKENIAFTIKEELENGNVEVIQGIFDKGSETVVDGVKYKAEKLDSETKQKLNGSPVKIYN